MIDVRLGFDANQYREAQELLRDIPRGMETAALRALNRTMAGMRTRIVRAITATYEITSSSAMETLMVKRATKYDLNTSLTSTGAAIPLDRFRVRPSEFSLPRPKIGIYVRVRKDRSGSRIPGTFFVPELGPIFRRKGKPRFPIKKQYGPAVPSMVSTVMDEQGLQAYAEERLSREMAHEVDYLLSKGASQ